MKSSLPEGRGDFSIPLLLGLFSLMTIATIGIARWMLPGFPFLYFVFFGFIFTPFMSFVNARLIGMVGQSLSIPFIKEGAIFLSGYRGVEVWFVPFALENYGAQAQKFREIELTGTKFTSILRGRGLHGARRPPDELSLLAISMADGADPIRHLSLCPDDVAAAVLPAMPLAELHPAG